MGLSYPGVPNWISDFVASSNKISTAVETGTHVGNSTRQLASKFQEVDTIETSAELFRTAQESSTDLKNISFHLGESALILKQILQNHTKPTFFWLDAHYSGGNTSGQSSPCPLIDELNLIAEWRGVGVSIICIDDARLFGAPHDLAPQMEGWPSTYEVLTVIHSMNLTSFIMDDVIVAIPEHLRTEFMKAYMEHLGTMETAQTRGKNILRKILK